MKAMAIIQLFVLPGRRFVLLLPAVFLVLFSSMARSSEDADRWLRTQEPIYLLNSPAQLDPFLRKLHEHLPDFPRALSTVARLRVGTPYVLGCLGEEKPPDSKPLFRLDVADCTVFVLTSSALAHARTYDEAREWMKKLNYYPVPGGGDPVSYENRIHFTYDRLYNSPYFQDITLNLASRDQLRRIELTLNVKANGQHLLNIPWKKLVTAYYLPSSLVTSELLERLPSPCGVAFIREKNFANGVVVSHEGMILDRRFLIHASSVSKKVEERDFIAFLRVDARKFFDGVIFYKFL